MKKLLASFGVKVGVGRWRRAKAEVGGAALSSKALVGGAVEFGARCACVTQAMADSLPEGGLGFAWWFFVCFFKVVVCPEVRINALLLDCE